MTDTYFFSIGGYRIVNSSNEGICVVGVPQGFGKTGSYLTSQRYVIIDAKRQKTGSIKVRMDLFLGKNTSLGHDYPP